MRIEKYYTTTSGEEAMNVMFEKGGEGYIQDQFAEALREAARHYVEKNMDKITAKLDLAGLGNLIAIYAAKRIGDSIRENQ